MHGGATPQGHASPHFRTGRRSALLNAIPALSKHYERALSDPDLLSLHDEIALTDARIAERLQRCKAGTVDAVWPELAELIEGRRKLVETASRRAKDLHTMVSADRVMALVSYLADSVRKHVTDRTVLTLIIADLTRVLRPHGFGELTVDLGQDESGPAAMAAGQPRSKYDPRPRGRPMERTDPQWLLEARRAASVTD